MRKLTEGIVLWSWVVIVTAGLTGVHTIAMASSSALFPVLQFLLDQESSTSGPKPGSHNTGYISNLSTLTAPGTLKIEQDGAVLEKCHAKGTIQVKANNVTIRDCLIETSGFYGIQANFGYTGLLIEDVEIRGMQSAGIIGSDFIVRRANIHDSGGDAIKPFNNVLIESSWLHRLGYLPESHSDGVQMVSGSNVTIRGNNIDMPKNFPGFTNSQCMIIQTNFGPIDNILIENNWLNGGGYCVQINDKDNGHGAPTNTRLLNNTFGRDCRFGLWRFRDSNPTVLGNSWEDTGQPVVSPLGCNDP